ncbi:MAG: hypothetical protein WAM97_01630 [Acidimicrobiales bacterium]|jgi:hypothetical protein
MPVRSRTNGDVNRWIRRAGAGVVAAGLIALVVCDLSIAGFRTFWDRHSLTGSIVSNLLVLAVTALIVDEVVARRQRRERQTSVAVQALLVYGQAKRAYGSVTQQSGADQPDAGSEEIRTFASMLLTASSTLFDDPVARTFLEEVQRMAALMVRALNSRTDGRITPKNHQKLKDQMARVDAAVAPLVGRIPREERSAIEDSGDL